MNLSVINQSKGRAREYSELSCNLFRGCTHGCLYCYVPACVRRSRAEFHATCEPRPDIIKRLKKDLAKLGDEPRAILLCFTCDPCAIDSPITLEAVTAIADAGHTPVLLTKNPARAIESYFDGNTLIDTGAWLGTSISCPNYEAAEWEPFAPPPMERFHALLHARRIGIPTWISFEPVINPGFILEHLHILVSVYPDIICKIGTLNHHEFAKSIDWAFFARKVRDLLKRSESRYYIKDDLWKQLKRWGIPQSHNADFTLKQKTSLTNLF